MAHNYILQVTAGSEYDVKTHTVVPVNSPTAVSIDSELMSVDLNVRIQVCPLLLPSLTQPKSLCLSNSTISQHCSLTLAELSRPSTPIAQHITLLRPPSPLQKQRPIFDRFQILTKGDD